MSTPRDPVDVLGELRTTPAGRALLEVATPQEGVWLVGGAVRDLLLRRRPRELDVVVEGDVGALAAALARRLGTAVTGYSAFGTASVGLGGESVDLARARRETYASPGALPTVAPATIEQDLPRRDFTINAIAVALSEPHPGRQLAAAHALADLADGRLRVLHDASFVDDPTRLLRLARYAARLAFFPDEHTRLLAGRAVAGGALHTVSGPRIGSELRLILAEEPRVALDALAELEGLDALTQLHPGLRLRRGLVEDALALLAAGDRADLLILASLALDLAGPGLASLWPFLDRLAFPARDRDAVVQTVAAVPRLQRDLPAARRGSQLHALADRAGVVAVALAGAQGNQAQARRWLDCLRHVRLEISGDDLVGAGIDPGPDLGRRLAGVLARRLDDDLPPGRDAELRAALEDRARNVTALPPR